MGEPCEARGKREGECNRFVFAVFRFLLFFFFSLLLPSLSLLCSAFFSDLNPRAFPPHR